MPKIQDTLRGERWDNLGFYAEAAKEAADRIDALEEVLRIQGGLLVGNPSEHRAQIVGQRLLDAANQTPF